MANVEIYTTDYCPYCVRAKDLLKRKGIHFEEKMISTQEDRIALMEKAAGRRTVPQIFINGEGIGGYDDLAALDASGELDKTLSS